jgi:hypothetical protein
MKHIILSYALFLGSLLFSAQCGVEPNHPDRVDVALPSGDLLQSTQQKHKENPE